MGYDIELIPMKLPPETKFPVEPAAAKQLIARSAGGIDPATARAALLKVPGCKPGPDDTIDYLGSGLSYARMRVEPKVIHVENNCGAKDLLKIQAGLAEALGPVFIHDLQSGQLHDPDSFAQWWAKPL
ncbi:MAG TPA: hypothetical protein PL151_08580 [Phycisphaerae bacterium]|nr:hypothetical protein [Phycisphaerae bacterium]HOJ76136.1 hypothetical protein [Phycisphaerae bacterium]HOM53121.1 hypothetical protein [Phycisphaerae bacterium]HON65756.1 hypothetical protein [Phycisphaerae bacterium]HOQ85509.1 hypothetical protein [Phycisphaerae bacterium]